MRVGARTDGRIVTLADREVITGLGRGLAERGTLDDAAITRTVDALGGLADEARALGAEVRAVGTSALRDAPDRDRFLDAARARGVEVEVISGQREAELTFRGAIDGLPIPDGNRVTVVDVGGGSTEVAHGFAGRAPTVSVSLDIGSVRLAALTRSAPLSKDDLTALELAVATARRGVPELDPRSTAIGVGGTALTAAAIVRGVPHTQLASLHGTRLDLGDLLRASSKLMDLTREELASHPSIAPGRAEFVVAGCTLFFMVTVKARAVSCLISAGGVRVGVLLECLDEGPFSG